jgi:hypothetical protein
LAAELSTKEATRPPKFDNSTMEERKVRELYGNSNYAPNMREHNRQFKPAQVGIDAVLDRNTKGKKAANLASNVLSNDDPEIAAQRAQWN